MKASRLAFITLTRPANTTLYTAGDVEGDVSGSAILTFNGLFTPTTNARNLLIVSAALDIQLAAIPSGMTSFRLHLFNTAPPAIADNAPFALAAADASKYLGFIDLGSPAVIGSILHTQADAINKQISVPAGTLYGLLQTNGAYTPTSGAVKTLTLSGINPDE